MFNPAWLSEITTDRKPLRAGIIPSIKTMLVLLALAMVMACGMWLWVSFWTGIYMSLSAFVPMVGQALAATLGITFLNFWFSRDINAAMLSTRDIRDDVLYGPTNPVDVTKMVNHLCHEMNAYFKEKFPDTHKDMPVPVLLTYTDDANFKIVTLEGRNPGKAALIFSSGAFDMRRMNQRQLAAAIQKELVKIYLRRGIARTFAGMLSDLATTLQNLNAPENAWFYRVLGVLTGPLQFVLLWERSISRSGEYEASAHVVEMGRGPDLRDLMDRKVCPSQLIFPMKTALKKNQDLHKRDPYQGRGPIKSFADWVDQYEYPRADKTGWRVIAYLDCMVNYLLYYINESWNRLPRSTFEKGFVEELCEAKLANGQSVTLLSVDNQEDLAFIYQTHREKNRKWYEAAKQRLDQEREVTIARAKKRGLDDLIPAIEKRLQPYEVIGPDGNGEHLSSFDVNLKQAIKAKTRPLKEQLAQMQSKLTQLQAQLDQVQEELIPQGPVQPIVRQFPEQVPVERDPIDQTQIQIQVRLH